MVVTGEGVECKWVCHKIDLALILLRTGLKTGNCRLLTFILYPRVVVNKDHCRAHLLTHSFTVLWGSHCKIHHYVAAPFLLLTPVQMYKDDICIGFLFRFFLHGHIYVSMYLGKSIGSVGSLLLLLSIFIRSCSTNFSIYWKGNFKLEQALGGGGSGRKDSKERLLRRRIDS